VLFASTNFPDNLDEALRRPGRFDVDVKFDYATHEQALEIFKHFYAPTIPVIQKANGTVPSSAFTGTEKSQVDYAAEKFADTVHEAGIKVSLATLQGFLLLYKRDPMMAQERVAEWAEGIRVKQTASPTIAKA
jgi:chaperone BCS1